MIAGYVGQDPVQALYLGSELIWSRTQPEAEPDFMQPLTFKILTGGTIGWTTFNSMGSVTHKTISYSLDSGSTWTQITSSTGGTPIQVSTGDVVMFKGTNRNYGVSNQNWCNFSGRNRTGYATNRTTAVFEVEGNIMSLFTLDNGDTYDDWENNWDGCDNLYWDLIVDFAYRGLFNRMGNCLTSVEHLIMPSQAMGYEACEGMFAGCTAIQKSPVLIAYPSCNADSNPEGTGSYYGMFSGCTSLSAVTYLYYDESGDEISGCTSWLSGVAQSGVFYVEGHSINNFQTGANGIPSGWQTQSVNACSNAYRKYWCGTDTEDECKCKRCGQGMAGYCDGDPCGYAEMCAENWEEMGYADSGDCLCSQYNNCPDRCSDWENLGYESYEDCRCQEYGECGDDPGYDCENCDGDPECECYCNGGEWDGENCNYPEGE